MFYVTALDGKRVAFLLGPFDSEDEAEQWVPAATKLACEKDVRAWFYSYGTAAAPHRLRDGVLNDFMPMCSWNAGGDPAAGCDAWALTGGLCSKHADAARELDKTPEFD